MPPRKSNVPVVLAEPRPALQLPDWNLLRSFVAVFETGTLTEAALHLGTTQPSVGRHIRELETQLGETLFVRLPGRLKPTARADVLYEAAARMRQAVQDAERLFAEAPQRVAGVVRVTSSEAYGYHVLPRMLMPLLVAEPGLELELVLSNATDNLLRREADIAIRFYRPQQDDVVARRVGTTELGLFAHEDYLARHGEPQSVDLRDGDIVAGFDRSPVDLGAVFPGRTPTRPVRFRFRSDAVLALQAAVESGFAMGIYPIDIAAERPGLRRVLADQISQPLEVWLCAHDELRRSRRMRCVWDFLLDALEARLSAASPGQRGAGTA
jgi:DNA-binding transcriptional LysR family regulator